MKQYLFFVMFFISSCTIFNSKKNTCIYFDTRIESVVEFEDISNVLDRDLLIIRYDTLGCLVLNKVFEKKDLKKIIFEFILNPKKNTKYSFSPNKARVIVRAWSYDNHLKNCEIAYKLERQLKKIYIEMRNKYAKETFNKSYNNLNETERVFIDNTIPFNFSTDKIPNLLDPHKGLKMK